MEIQLPGVALTPPEEFLAEEVTACWRAAPGGDDLKDPRALQMQMEVRPNLIAQRRKVDAGEDVGSLVSKVVADLVRHVPGISTVDTSELEFDDGGKGFLLKYTVPGPGEFSLVQMQAARKDGDVFTTLTITNEVSRLNDQVVDGYMACLRSAKPA